MYKTVLQKGSTSFAPNLRTNSATLSLQGAKKVPL